MSKKPNSRRKKQQQKKMMFGVAGFAALIAIAIGLYFTVFSSDPVVGDIIAEAATLGHPDAEVVIVEYADFQCSACRFMALNLTPELIREFVDTGIVRLEFRHFSHYGAESDFAGMASECANEQGAFWEFHDYLYNAQGQPNSGVYTLSRLKNYASRLGLNNEEFNECLGSGKYRQKVRQHTQEAINRGGTGTPTVFVNDVKLGGVPSMPQLRGLIQRELGDR